jgi:hypothetical protein
LEAELLDISDCPLLTEVPDLPVDHLLTLYATRLRRVTRLPALGTDKYYEAIHLHKSGIVDFPDLLPCIDEFSCSGTPIQRLPRMAGCRRLFVKSCEQLQQLPEHLPADLDVLDLSGCTSLQQLPFELPASLRVLKCEGCSSLQALPDMTGSSLQHLWIKGCEKLTSVRVGGCEDLVVHLQ